jgi:polyphosphate kinase
VVPVESPVLAARIDEILELCLADDVLAWRLDGAGEWRRSTREQELSAQEELIRRASLRSDESLG